jgi:Tol biopolymer transport system component
MNPDGTGVVNLTNDSTYDDDPSWYPSGDKLAVTCGAVGVPPTQTDICSMSFDEAGNVARTNLTRLPTESGTNWIDDFNAAVSPDGERIAFVRRSNVEGDRDAEIYVKDADRREGPDNPAVKLTDNATYWDRSPDWSPGGSKIAYSSEDNRNGNSDIFVMNADGTGKKKLTKNAALDTDPAFSPNGRFIVFVSNRDGDYEVWRMRRDGSRKVQLTRNTVHDYTPDWQPRP